MNGISTKLTAATLTGAVLVILSWIFVDPDGLLTLVEVPDRVSDAVQLLAIFAAGYLIREGALKDDEFEPSPIPELPEATGEDLSDA